MRRGEENRQRKLWTSQCNVAAAESVKESSPDVPSVPHDTQDLKLQKPQATQLRLPAEGGPCECEHEAAEIVVMAEGTNGMVKLPMEVADLDEMAVLDGKPAMRACGVDEDDEIAHLHDEDSQHDENARDNLPEAHGVPLDGEWAVCASGSVKSSSGAQSSQTHRWMCRP